MAADWHFLEETACLECGNWSLRTQPLAPWKGLEIEGPQQVWSSLLRVQALPQPSQPVEEAYVRESDLIVRFGQSAADQFSYQLNWKHLTATPPWGLGIELWVSIQTALLDTNPQLIVHSGPLSGSWKIWEHSQLSLASIETLRPGTPAALVNSSPAGCACWLIQPADQRQVALRSSSSDSTQTLRLFGHFMEKGVIRRARMRLWLTDRPISGEQLAAAYQEFANSPLPLTA